LDGNHEDCESEREQDKPQSEAAHAGALLDNDGLNIAVIETAVLFIKAGAADREYVVGTFPKSSFAEEAA
jgi:hypothetical protein